MNIKKIFALAAVSTMASFAFADAANTLITFSTPGPDTYADGTTVKDGEIYALVWSKDGNFDGFTATGDAADTNDKVIFKAPLAKDGHCGLTLFQIDSKVAPQGGEYAVYLLDTRADFINHSIVTGSALARTFGGTSGTQNIAANGKIDNTKNGLASTSDGIGGSEEQLAKITPVITGFKVDGANIKITVSNVFEGLPYVVQTGLEKNGELKAEKIEAIEGGLEFTVKPGDANFFSIKLK